MPLNISVKGKVKQTVSIQIEDILPSLIKAIKDDLGLPEDTEIHYTSKTTFLSFNVIRNENQRKKCQCEKYTLERLGE